MSQWCDMLPERAPGFAGDAIMSLTQSVLYVKGKAVVMQQNALCSATAACCLSQSAGTREAVGNA